MRSWNNKVLIKRHWIFPPNWGIHFAIILC